jgi:SH3-like domain-containing protein
MHTPAIDTHARHPGGGGYHRMLTQTAIFMGVIALTIILAQPVWAERLALAVNKANVRSGPGTDKYEVLWEIERYHPLQVIQRQGDWIFFKDFEGDEGWIHIRLVDKTPTVITRKDMVNIRTGPGTDAAIGFQAEKGVPLKVLERKGEWLRIQSAYGDKGWIHRKLVW